VDSGNESMSGWLARAIVMENVSAWSEGTSIELPAGPYFRVEKEVKNVITVIAKTNHYFADHLRSGQQRAIEKLFRGMQSESPFVQAAVSGHGFDRNQHDALSARIAAAVQNATGLTRSAPQYDGWLGIECPAVQMAIWMMRALTTVNVASRREDKVLYLPVNPTVDPIGEFVVWGMTEVYGYAAGIMAEEEMGKD
jgi:hypothetical protein